MPGLHEVSFKNDALHPNAAAVLSVCAARKIPAVTLKYAADVTEVEILDFLRTSKELVIVNLRRLLSDTFFETIVEVRHQTRNPDIVGTEVE